jgi:hypothetical protein
VEKEAENHSGKEKNRNGDLCKEKKIAFLLEWEKISLDKSLLMGDKSLLMGDPFHSQKDQSFGCFTTPARTM